MAVSGSFSTPRSYKRSTGDKTRRGRWLDAVSDAPLSRGAKAWAMLLAKRSSATAKPVWGYQTGQAEAIGCSDRQVRRYRRELEQVGLIETCHGAVERHRDGRFSRTMTNLYKFVVAPLARRRKSKSDAPDIHDRSNPLSKREIETLPDTRNQKIVLIDDGWSDSDFSPDEPWATSSV